MPAERRRSPTSSFSFAAPSHDDLPEGDSGGNEDRSSCSGTTSPAMDRSFGSGATDEQELAALQLVAAEALENL